MTCRKTQVWNQAQVSAGKTALETCTVLAVLHFVCSQAFWFSDAFDFTSDYNMTAVTTAHMFIFIFHSLLSPPPPNSKVWIPLMRWPLSLLLLCMTWTTQVAPTASCAMQEVSWPSSTMTQLCLRATTLLWPSRSPPETISATFSRTLNGTGLAVTFNSFHFFIPLKVNRKLLGSIKCERSPAKIIIFIVQMHLERESIFFPCNSNYYLKFNSKYFIFRHTSYLSKYSEIDTFFFFFFWGKIWDKYSLQIQYFKCKT